VLQARRYAICTAAGRDAFTPSPRNAKRVGDVDKTRQGTFLFN
jgi:hypothetical protein